jgi:hypothetical protein
MCKINCGFYGGVLGHVSIEAVVVPLFALNMVEAVGAIRKSPIYIKDIAVFGATHVIRLLCVLANTLYPCGNCWVKVFVDDCRNFYVTVIFNDTEKQSLVMSVKEQMVLFWIYKFFVFFRQ